MRQNFSIPIEKTHVSFYSRIIPYFLAILLAVSLLIVVAVIIFYGMHSEHADVKTKGSLYYLFVSGMIFMFIIVPLLAVFLYSKLILLELKIRKFSKQYKYGVEIDKEALKINIRLLNLTLKRWLLRNSKTYIELEWPAIKHLIFTSKITGQYLMVPATMEIEYIPDLLAIKYPNWQCSDNKFFVQTRFLGDHAAEVVSELKAHLHSRIIVEDKKVKNELL